MASERRNGAGAKLAGLLERSAQPEPIEPEPVEVPTDETPGDDGKPKGRGGSRKPRPVPSSAAKRATGRTVYIDDDLWERIIVQAHRRRRTISEYISSILDRNVPDHRVVRPLDPPADVG